MDTRLLKYYEQELGFLREMGAEFSEAFPKVAARLGMEGLDVLDPYVERLMEGFAFLSARVQLELALQYPTFTQHLLEIVYPHYVAPTPSMIIAQLRPDPTQGGLENGYMLPRGTALRSPLREGDTTACVFTTGNELVLWPLEISEAEYIDGRGELVATGMGEVPDARAAIRLRLRHLTGESLSNLSLDKLLVYLDGEGGQPWRLYEHLAKDGVAIFGRSTNRRADWVMRLGGNLPLGERPIRPMGFSQEERLLPYPGPSFDGYRLFQEYFALPQRFFFIELSHLQAAISRTDESALDIYVLMNESAPGLRETIDRENFRLHVVPAINLFEKRCDRVRVRETDIESHVVPDRTAPMDFEVHHLTRVTGIGSQGEDDVEFRPFYSADDLTAAGESHAAYYAVKRRMRQRSERQRLRGARTSYLGSELYLSLVDRENAPYPKTIEQLAVVAACSNRDLPLILSIGSGRTDFYLPEGGPVAEIRAIVSPTRPRPSLGQGDSAWRLISHLSLNYLSISDSERGSGAAALRELLSIYAPLGDRAMHKQLEGIINVRSRPIVRRLRDQLLTTAVRGVEVEVAFDESFFEGTGVYLLGAVLERFFAKYVALNSFTETVIRSQDRGEITRWRPRSGNRLLI